MRATSKTNRNAILPASSISISPRLEPFVDKRFDDVGLADVCGQSDIECDGVKRRGSIGRLTFPV
ncbi:hypothetical protein Pla52o_45310 [Novipirellula galeiformis]|uniref:Uncharacterized protein n=1 Tax=Novipirellula galeiformis TaxID=2528004 RepID=A0A5C6C8Z8_9BACT|nr:hypothetical protein Pla52o_45310 [Novipirellula galeiformis]